ncbi:hypothetical protein ACFOYW_05020 [Gryllotalpicola reticulitermitis]|uniref:DUF2975 domain-containing protein n=1 Tax=Gryllotalpicola reticulitermitis TaxID=1184153 RepID=A0ABV8Q561_9MICO
MSTVDEAGRPLTRSHAVRFIYWTSLAYLVLAAIELVDAVVQLSTRLGQRSSGIIMTWNPGFPAPQPTHYEMSGAPYVAQGSTAYFTQMTGTVRDVPVASIVVTGLGDIVSVLCGAGIAVCIFVLAQRMAAGAPFVRASARALVALAAIVFFGFEGAQVLHAVGSNLAENVLIASPQEPDGQWSPPISEGPGFSLLPIYVSVGLLALAAVFRAGAAYRDDSDGLV